MNATDVKSWACMTTFDPTEGVIIRRAPGASRGYWTGAPSVRYEPEESAFYLLYRLRRPRGEAPDRGAEVHLARSEDGIEFETIWTGRKEQLGTASIERCCLARDAHGRWLLYVSYVDPADGRWRIDRVDARRPDQFDLSQPRPVLTASDVAAEGIKDPFVFRFANRFYMLASFATATTTATADQLHGTEDAYNTGLIRSASGLAVSDDGSHWHWQGEVFGPSATGWDRYCARVCCVWRCDGVWLALYDGAADVRENYEEQVGLAYSYDLSRFQRVTGQGPLMRPPGGTGGLRYFDVLRFPDATFFYYEMVAADGSHDLRVYRQRRNND